MSANFPLPQPPDELDPDVTGRIRSLLWQRGGPWLANVDVRFHLGTATLSGTVRSEHERYLCIACCEHVPGVQKVVDELKVQYVSSVPLEVSGAR